MVPADNSGTNTSSSGNTRKRPRANLRDGKQRWRNVNLFQKHKLKKYNKYIFNRRQNHASDSGQFGSSSMLGSSSACNSDKRSAASTASSCTSTSPSSGDSQSPQTFQHVDIQQQSDQPMCMMLGHAVPLVVMMQGQLQSTASSNSDMSYSNTMLFKCNMCNMFSNNLTDVLTHVNSNHANVHYCFVCHQFHSSKSEYDRHKNVCATARQAFQQIIDGHYSRGNPSTGAQNVDNQEQVLNLSVAGNVAMRAAQMVHNKKNKRTKIKKLQKCTYCKKAFFGQFYLQRHLRSHTGEKLCHCSICGKGFAEWRNLRNHMSRFHNNSESNSSGGRQSKSASPNITSDSDHTNYPNNGMSQESRYSSQQGVGQDNTEIDLTSASQRRTNRNSGSTEQEHSSSFPTRAIRNEDKNTLTVPPPQQQKSVTSVAAASVKSSLPSNSTWNEQPLGYSSYDSSSYQQTYNRQNSSTASSTYSEQPSFSTYSSSYSGCPRTSSSYSSYPRTSSAVSNRTHSPRVGSYSNGSQPVDATSLHCYPYSHDAHRKLSSHDVYAYGLAKY